MPWATSDRRSRLPPDWHARRQRTKRLAGGQCQHTDQSGNRCTWQSPPHGTGQPDGHADHITASGNDDQSNLQWLCPPHHYAKSSAEGVTARADKAATRTRKAESHPGTSTPPP